MHLFRRDGGAATQVEADWEAADPDGMDRRWAINLREALVLTQAPVPAMEARGWGRIRGLASVQAARPHPRMMVYAALKAAMANALRNLAEQVAARGATANLISPGAMGTPRNAATFADPALRGRALDRIPARRFCIADDRTGAALFLCSAAHVNGADIPVDGGMNL